MKLSDHIININLAFEALLSSFDELEQEHLITRDNFGRRVRRDLQRDRSITTVPRIVPTYPPQTPSTTIPNKECLLQLAAFEATYYNNITPISPDMVPLVIDTGASITVTPYSTDFISPIRPIQSVEIKGIASGLQVKGYGDVRYSFHNDAGELQSLTLQNCLYVPHCTARLLCPRQIGATTGHPEDGFNAVSKDPILTFEGKPTTIKYNDISGLPILYTAPGVTSFYRFCANQSFLSSSPDKQSSPTAPPLFLYRNLTPSQQRKLHLHECCAHAHWVQINSWIRNGSLPCDRSLASVPDPVCVPIWQGSQTVS